MTGLSFGSEGPLMEGSWFNPKTGDSFTVRNSFFEDNQYIVQTTDGRVLGYEQIQNYIKSDKPIQAPEKPIQPIAEELPAEVLGILEGNTTNNLGNLYEIPNPIVNQAPTQNEAIIEKALSKKSIPEFKVRVVWGDYPEKEVGMLMDIMDISKEEIIEWYLNKIDLASTTALIKDCIRTFLESPKPAASNTKEDTKAATKKSTKTTKKK